MKYLMILTVGVCLLVAPVLAEQQTAPPKPGPEHKRMESALGKWTCEFTGASGTSTGEQTCELFGGGFFVVCSYKTAQQELRGVMGYNRHEKAYTMFRYRSNGRSDMSKGWIRDDAWTWVFEDERINDKLRRRQLTVTEVSPELTTFKWEVSVEGEPWRVTQEGKCTKVKATTN